MAIYHLEAKVVSRGTGRSAVAASAYLSCTNILNDYDGVRYDYTRKKGLIWREVFLPEYAPPEWKDRGVLWNAVEENEKTKDSRLAREFVPALPVELTPTQWQELLSDFIKESFVADGMCADVAMEMSRNVQSGNTQNLKSMVIQRSFPKWSVAERRKTAAASNQAAVCACAHSRYFAGGSPSGLRV